MALHHGAFFLGERTRLEKDAIGNSELSNIVEMRAACQAAQLTLRPAHGPRNLKRVAANALGVACGLIVTRVDRSSQRLKGVFIAPFDLLKSCAELARALRNHILEMLAVIFHLPFQI